MDSKLLMRIGAGAFVAVALTMAVLDLREESAASPPETLMAWEPDGDPLPGQLRACAAMGELALSSPDCRRAWAEKRRRFLGIDRDEAASDPTMEQKDNAVAASDPNPPEAN